MHCLSVPGTTLGTFLVPLRHINFWYMSLRVMVLFICIYFSQGLTVLSWNSQCKQSGLILKRSPCPCLSSDGIKGLCHGHCVQSFGFGSVSRSPGRPPALSIADDLEHLMFLLLPWSSWVVNINIQKERNRRQQRSSEPEWGWNLTRKTRSLVASCPAHCVGLIWASQSRAAPTHRALLFAAQVASFLCWLHSFSVSFLSRTCAVFCLQHFGVFPLEHHTLPSCGRRRSRRRLPRAKMKKATKKQFPG